MHDLFWRQRTGALGLVRGYGTNCMRERGPARVRIGCARSPGSRASIDRPVAGRRWQSARTLHPRGQAHREKGPVRAEGAGAHLWDHLDNLQRLRRPRSRHPESLGCRPESTGKARFRNTCSSGREPHIKRLKLRMERHGLHAPIQRFGVPFAPSRAGPAEPRGARPFSHEVGGPESGYAAHRLPKS